MPLVIIARVTGATANESEVTFAVSVRVSDPGHDGNSEGSGYSLAHSAGLSSAEEVNSWLLAQIKSDFPARRPGDRFVLIGGASGVLTI